MIEVDQPVTMDEQWVVRDKGPDLRRHARHHRNVLWLSVLLCLFLLADAYVVPLKDSIEIVEDYNSYRSGRRGQHTNFTLTTNKDQYDIPGFLYNDLKTDRPIVLEKSVLTGAVQFARLEDSEKIYRYDIGYIRSILGKVFLGILGSGIAAMFLFFWKIDNIRGRANLTYALFISSLLLLFAHLDWNPW